GGARGVLDEKDGDGFAVGRPLGRSEKAFHAGEFSDGASGGGNDIKLALAGGNGIGEEDDFPAVRRPGDAAFLAGRARGSGDAPGGRFSIGGGNVEGGEGRRGGGGRRK